MKKIILIVLFLSFIGAGVYGYAKNISLNSSISMAVPTTTGVPTGALELIGGGNLELIGGGNFELIGG